MSSAGSARSAPTPSHQEVARKLSVRSAAKPIKKPSLTTPISGTESDSDSVLSPDVLSTSPLNTPLGLSHGVGSLTQPPLQAIVERRSGSGEESEEDDEEDEGVGPEARGSHDETVLKTGYLWKKGERRKTWKKRWFVLRPAHLAFYKTAAEYKLLRLLDLSDIHSCSVVQLKKHANSFVLVSPTRTFYLEADVPQEVFEWVKAITEARTSLLSTSTQNSATAPIPIPRSASQGQQVYHQASAPPVSPSLSHSPYNHHLTSSDSDDASPSVPRPPQNAHAGAPSDIGSTSKNPGPIDPSKVILSGYLVKCGSRRHTWHNRWFVLTGDKLVYSRSHMDTKPHRSIPLAQFLDALEYDLPPARPAQQALGPLSPPHASNAEGEFDGAGKHTFKIVTTKRTLLLSAPSEEEEIKWLSAVRALIARRSVVPGDSAAAHAHVQQPPPQTHSLPAPLPSQAHGSSATIHPPAAASNSKATAAASVSLPVDSSGGGIVAPGPSSAVVGSGGATGPQKRRDSIARRLSLGGGGSFTSHIVSNSGGGGGGSGAGVLQEA